MSIKYLNKDLLVSDSPKILVDENLLGAAEYFLRRECGARLSDSVDFDLIKKLDNTDMINEIILNFKTNVARLLGKKIGELNLPKTENGWIAAEYLSRTFPYCMYSDTTTIKPVNLDAALQFFAKNTLHANDEQLELIIKLLKIKNMHNIDCEYTNDDSIAIRHISFSDIIGTAEDKYKADTLYDELILLDDKNIYEFINYILIKDGLDNPYRIIHGNPALFAASGFYYCVVDGSHRFILGKAINEISSIVTLNCFTNNNIFPAKVLKKTL